MTLRKSLLSVFWPLAALAAVSAAAIPSPAATTALATVTSGAYVDSSGAKQTWHVDGAHRLIWDDKPFVPVGGRFQAHSWAPDATEDDWKADQAALAILKAHNVTDVYLQPARGYGLTEVPARAIQRMVDALDADGFTYGISIDDGPHNPLTGFVVRPGAYRQELVDGGDSVRFPATGFKSFLYIVSSTDGPNIEVMSTGSGLVSNGAAVVPMPGQISKFGNLGAKIVVNLLPQKEFDSGKSEVGYPDLWGGFDEYRDRLLTVFRAVRLGKGFRFFVDALPPTMSLEGAEAEQFIPTGPGFTTEWSAYLSRKYRTLSSLELSWSIADHDAKDIAESAHFLPLWSERNGVPDFYDRQTRKLVGLTNVQFSRYWTDLRQFKAESIQRYMNDLALCLKRAVADVPVVYRSSGPSSMFHGIGSDEGFDGIGIDAYGRGTELVENSAGYVYAQVTDAQRTLWLPVTSTADAPPATKTVAGYVSQPSMQSDFDYLREIGARGFYVDALQFANGSTDGLGLISTPVQLDWLSKYQHFLVATGVSAAETPDTIFFPPGTPGLNIRVAGNVPIVPTSRPAVLFDFGPVGRGYVLSDAVNGNVYYLYNSAGPRQVHIKVPRSLKKIPNALEPEWLPHVAGTRQRDTITLTIGPDPVRLLNMPSVPVPTETIPALSEEANSLLALMKRRNIGVQSGYQVEVDDIKMHLDTDQPIRDVQKYETQIEKMKALLRPYAWFEAENAIAETFDERAERAGASGGSLLLVGPRPEGSPAPLATYQLDVSESGPQEIWAAASPGAPLTFRIDGSPLLDKASVPTHVGAPFADGTLVWQKYGIATLNRGSYTLEVRAGGPAAVDVILVIKPNTFRPDGITQPPVE